MLINFKMKFHHMNLVSCYFDLIRFVTSLLNISIYTWLTLERKNQKANY